MKKVRCPKCENYITFDDSSYECGQMLVFECTNCRKQFKIRIKGKEDVAPENKFGYLVVVENIFHFRQEIPLKEGDNVIGRRVQGTNANMPIDTIDPSIDTTHCIINVRATKQGPLKYTLRDAPSNTGTFYMNDVLGVGERRVIENESIITIGATTLILHAKQEES
ncbi:MAG: FHA domain-containing protein [Bacteroidaceae bacterium]